VVAPSTNTWKPRSAVNGFADGALLAEIPVGGARLFNYPTDRDPCILVHHAANEYAAYSTKCTHLSCAVVWAPAEGKLECPCHHGFFSVRDGRVRQGPPPAPLPLTFTSSPVLV